MTASPSTTPAQVVVGIDLGTSAVKVLAATIGGRDVASGSEFYGLVTPQPDFVGQDPEAVYRATMRVLQRVLADVRMRGSEVAAIGFSSAMHGVLCVDDAGEPLSNVMTWMDRRAHAIADGWRADATAADLYAVTGAPMHPMLPIAKLRWLADHEPELFGRTHRFVGLKELLIFRWTGDWLVDWGIASATGMFDLRAHAWHPAALACAGVDAARLSVPAAPSTVIHALRPSIASELGLTGRIAVVLASADGPLANIGVGTTQRGDVALTLGTSGAVRILADAPLLDTAGRTFCYCADDRRYVVGGPTSAAGASLDWIFALLLGDVPKDGRFAHAASLAATVAAGSDGLTVLPFFAGERAPYWDSSLRGVFDGLDLAHDRRTIIRAGFEGVVFGVFAVYGVMREIAGDATRLLLTGGLTKAPLVRALLADVFELPAVVPHQEEASAFGAALVAAQAIGLIDDAVAAGRAVGYDTPTLPDSTTHAAYDRAFARYAALVGAHVQADAAARVTAADPREESRRRD